MNYKLSICLIFAFLGVFLPFSVHSQTDGEQKLIDSLRKVARNPNQLKAVCFQLLKSSNHEALYEGNYGLGYAHLSTNQLDSASYYYHTAKKYAELLNNPRKISSSLLKLQTVNASTGKQDSLLKYIQISKDFAIENEDLRLLAETYKYEGIHFKNQKRYQESVKSSIEAAKINKSINNPMQVNNYGNIAIVYKRMKQDSLALEWFLKAYRASKEFNYFPAKFASTNNLANFYYTDLKQLDSAKYYYNKLLLDSLKLNPLQKNQVYLNLFSIHLEQDSLTTAQTYFKVISDYWKNKPESRKKAEYYDEASQFYIKKEDFKNALAYNDSAYFYVKEHQLSDKILFLMLERSRILEALKQHEKANKIYKEFIELKDSLLLLQDSEALQNSINQFNLAERENDLKKQLDRSKPSTNYTYLAIGFLLFVGFYYSYKKKRKSVTEQPNSTYIRLTTNEKLNYNHIEFIKAEGHYVEYILEGIEKPVYERSSLKSVIERLDNSSFIQTHRSYLVNTDKILKIHTKEIHLASGKNIPLSRSFKEKLKKEEHPLFV